VFSSVFHQKQLKRNKKAVYFYVKRLDTAIWRKAV